ncbi:hypothetical protein N7516_000345 [Penicillium verrucosum]|uniref:uncharacterized protein n=1 Tax=Penicillium verrucosum TaxID=60171 RepID=UPI002545A898|nr:uncharacterized protein N7516_000345 [Penicillium verrucosum]KAJ5940177.1 hypothetical protein N7516_000345 [Penicillium verrucosum]
MAFIRGGRYLKRSHIVPLRPPTASLFEAITIVTITIVPVTIVPVTIVPVTIVPITTIPITTIPTIPVTTIPVTINVNRPGYPTNIHEQCHLPQYKRSYPQTLSERLLSRVFFLQSTIHTVKLSLYSTHHTTIRYPRSRYLSIRRTSPCKRVSTTSFARSQSLRARPHPIAKSNFDPWSSTQVRSRNLGTPHFLEILNTNTVNLPAIKAPAPASTITNKPTTPNALIIRKPMVRYSNLFNN